MKPLGKARPHKPAHWLLRKVHQLRGGQEAGGKAEGNIILTGELAILATGVAVAIPGTAGWPERPIHGGGDYNEFVPSDSGLMGFFTVCC
jgi:hypothetical protein